MRNCIGHSGHGVDGERVSGGFGSSSNCVHRSRALPVAGAQAIGARIAAADDDHVFAGGQNLAFHGIAFAHLVLLRQKLHREVYALQLASRDIQIARLLRAARQQDGVELAPQVFHRNIPAHVRIGLELHPFGAHLLQPPVDQVLLHLEIRNAVAQQSADTVALFEHRDVVPGARQLLRGRQSRRSAPDHRHALAAAHSRRLGNDVALLRTPGR